MMTINQIHLHLPSGMEGRARTIANRLGESLVDVPVTRSLHLHNLHINDVQIVHGQTDQQIVAQIRASIVTKLEGML